MKDFLIYFVGTIAVQIIVISLAIHLSAQKAERGTKTWEMSSGFDRVPMTVIDTSGVCLYVIVTNQGPAIAAVPKTQLPQGAGCQ